MFDRLIEFIMNQINNIVPVAEIFQFQKGVRYRFGKTDKTLDPGWHLKIPFFDKVLQESVVLTTLTLPVQSVISKDNKNLVVKGTIVLIVDDIVKYLNTIYNARDAIADRTCLIIREVIKEKTFEECRSEDLNKIFTRKIRKIAKEHGMYIFLVGLTDITDSFSLRLYNEQSQLV
jgi:regulator of protease activity HflC (stomatin/prohibitin superfamily)